MSKTKTEIVPCVYSSLRSCPCVYVCMATGKAFCDTWRIDRKAKKMLRQCEDGYK